MGSDTTSSAASSLARMVTWPCSSTRGPGSTQKAESLNQVVNGPSEDHSPYQLCDRGHEEQVS